MLTKRSVTSAAHLWVLVPHVWGSAVEGWNGRRASSPLTCSASAQRRNQAAKSAPTLNAAMSSCTWLKMNVAKWSLGNAQNSLHPAVTGGYLRKQEMKQKYDHVKLVRPKTTRPGRNTTHNLSSIHCNTDSAFTQLNKNENFVILLSLTKETSGVCEKASALPSFKSRTRLRLDWRQTMKQRNRPNQCRSEMVYRGSSGGGWLYLGRPCRPSSLLHTSPPARQPHNIPTVVFWAFILQEFDELGPVEQLLCYLHIILEAQQSKTRSFSSFSTRFDNFKWWLLLSKVFEGLKPRNTNVVVCASDVQMSPAVELLGLTQKYSTAQPPISVCTTVLYY